MPLLFGVFGFGILKWTRKIENHLKQFRRYLSKTEQSHHHWHRCMPNANERKKSIHRIQCTCLSTSSSSSSFPHLKIDRMNEQKSWNDENVISFVTLACSTSLFVFRLFTVLLRILLKKKKISILLYLHALHCPLMLFAAKAANDI